MSGLIPLFAALAALLCTGAAWAAGPDLGQADKQAPHWTAISMFPVFVPATLWITTRDAAITRSAAAFSRRSAATHSRAATRPRAPGRSPTTAGQVSDSRTDFSDWSRSLFALWALSLITI